MNALSLRQKGIVGIFGLTQALAYGSTYYLPAVLADPISKSLHLPCEWFFAIFSCSLLLAAFFGPAAGNAIDRYGGRKILLLSNLFFAVGLLLLSLSVNLIGLVFAWAVLGMGMSLGLYEAAFATLAGIYGDKAQKAIMGITLIAGFGSTIGWSTTLFLLDLLGWRGTCATWALIHILIALPLNFWVIPSTFLPQVEKSSKSDVTAKSLWILAGAFSITEFISAGIATHLPRLLCDLGIGLKGAVVIAGLLGPSQVFSRWVTYGFSDRYSPITSSRLAIILYPIGGLCLLILGIPTAALFVILCGIGKGMLTIARGTLPLALYGVAGYGLRTGLLAVPVRFSQAMAPFLFGLTLDRGGASSALFLSIGLGSIAFMIMARLVPIKRSA